MDEDTEAGKYVSLIDCGIKSMLTLNLPMSGRHVTSLNLHSNSITRIEGLQNLIQLTHLDLSSNQITIITGLSTLG